jgi:copper/silver efflux system protein
VILAMPFAFSGGVFLLKLLGYNFSLPFGSASSPGSAPVQTGVVLVIYREEAVEQTRMAMGRLAPQRGDARRPVAFASPNHDCIHGCGWLVADPAVETPGAEVMKPLAKPVLGGVVSSLLHIPIVTPVIFTWLCERELSKAGPNGERKK